MRNAISALDFHPPVAYSLPPGATLSSITVASDGTVVLVTQVPVSFGINPRNEFRCAVGTCADGTITFHYEPTSFFRLDGTASGLDVAIDDHQRVVFVFNNGTDLWYVTGTLGSNRYITWNDGVQFDSGDTPSVAISNGGWVLEAHRSQNDNSQVFYHYGPWNGAVIDGFKQRGKDVSGLKIGSIDSVSAAVNASGNLVVGWSGGDLGGSSCTAINGTADGDTVKWHYLKQQDFGGGDRAHLSIADNGRVVATYSPVFGFVNPDIRYRVGLIADGGQSIAFDDEAKYPAVAFALTSALSAGGNLAVMLYQTSEATFVTYADLI